MAKRKTANNKTVDVAAVKHKDKRTNIPTEELRGFVAEDELKPKQVTLPGLLYARDPSLDPQLVWTGKDKLDSEELTVPAVPVYIQEKIHPQAIIEDVKARAKADAPPPQMDLFSDFNGIQFEDLIDFYHHESNWANRMILGDSLLSMVSLAEKEGLKGKVQMVYIDPPYGIKFNSNWQVSTRKADVKDGKATDATRQPEQIRAFRDTWELGIHSYLSYWRDRLVAARELLTETGSVFVQINNENVHLVRCLIDEVFGADNFICQISFEKRGAQPEDYLSTVNDIILWYGKDRPITKYKQLYWEKGKDVEMTYPNVELASGEIRRITSEEKANSDLLPKDCRPCTTDNLTSSHYYESPPFKWRGKVYKPGNRYWSTSIQGMKRLSCAGRLVDAGKTIRMLRYLDDFPVVLLGNVWTDTRPSSFAEDKWYVVQTAQKVIQRCMLMCTDPGDLVLDPTCGSGSTAYVAEQWGTASNSPNKPSLKAVPAISAADNKENTNRNNQHIGTHQDTRPPSPRTSANGKPSADDSKPPHNKLNREEIRFLTDISARALSTTVSRYQRLNLSRRKGNAIRQSLAAAGLIEAVTIATRSGQVVLYQLTENGRMVCESEHIDPGPRHRESLEHRYWVRQTCKHFEKQGYTTIREHPVKGNGAVDILAQKAGRQVVIEVETGKSDIANNIEKIKKYPFDQVILVATNPAAAGKCQRVMEKASDSQKTPIEVLTWLDIG